MTRNQPLNKVLSLKALGPIVLIWLCLSPFSQSNLGHLWVSTSGSVEDDDMRSIFVDDSGYIYATGLFRDTMDFDPGPDVFEIDLVGGSDIFIEKLDPDGNLVWVKQIAGISYESPGNIVLDTMGNIIVSGQFSGTVDFDPGSGEYFMTSTPGYDIYILKLDSNGEFLWAISVGGTDSEEIQGLEIDPITNDIVYTGYYKNSIDFNPGTGSFIMNSLLNYYDIFVSRLDENGNFIWAKTFGGNELDRAYDLDIDESGNIYFTGEFDGVGDYDPGPGLTLLVSEGNYDACLVKLSSAGELIWAKSYGGVYNVQGTCAQLSPNGKLIVAGFFDEEADLDPGPGSYDVSGVDGDPYVISLDTAGTFEWARTLQGGIGLELIEAVSFDSTGHICIAGDFDDSLTISFASPPVTEYLDGTAQGYYIVILDSLGEYYASTSLGGDFSVLHRDLFAKDNSIFICGRYYWYADFDPGPGYDPKVMVGEDDFFVQKLFICNGTSSGSVFSSSDTSFCTTDGTITTESLFDDYVWSTGDSTSTISIDESGTYSVVVGDSLGCVSMDTIDVSFNGSSSSFSISECYDYTVPSGDETYTSEGIYYDTIPNSVGCDSVMTITLNLNNSFDTIIVSKCESYTVPSGDESYTESGVIYDTIPNTLGCDSLLTIYATILDSSSSTLSVTECSVYTVPSGDETYSTSGVYLDTLTNALGCDSIINIDLTIIPVDELDLGPDTIACVGMLITLFPGGTFDNYIWSTGSIENSIEVSTSGIYIVNGYTSGCSASDTILVEFIDCLNLSESNGNVLVYPNPGKGEYYIQSPNPISEIQITNFTGMIIRELSSDEIASPIQIDQEPGVYFLLITTSTGQKFRAKVIKS